MKLTRAAFIFVCKDDDRLHVERFEFDQAEFEKYEARAERIVRAAEPPLRIHEDPAWHECRFCAYREVCKGTAAPAPTCRSCAHASPVLDGDAGAWRCERHDGEIPVEFQRQGCADHRFIPVLLARFARPMDSDGDSVTYQAEDGTFTNGPAPGWSSAEIHACQDKRFLSAAADMPEVQKWREEFGAHLVG
jgi:hypothetical protein